MTNPAIPATIGAQNAMPMDGFLDTIGQINLDSLMPNMRSYGPDLMKDREAIASLAAKMALSEYRPVIEWLLDASLRRSSFIPMQSADQTVQYAAYREGQNSMIWQLLQLIAEGRGEFLPAREGM